MSLLLIVTALAAALLLMTGGYFFGVRRGAAARDGLREQGLRQAHEIEFLREDAAGFLSEREQSLRATIEQALAPLFQRNQLSIDLSRVKAGTGEPRDLTKLLDRIADVGNFSAVVLGDAEGLPLAANSRAQDPDRIAATSSMVLMTADRIASAHMSRPVSVMVRDESDKTTLCRMFNVQERRVTLTVVATGGSLLTPAALDPALVKVAGALTGP
jgi:predicted regulator of Ras-like GTPase activity (Roadblock/LC7/MglB family)